MVRMLGNIRQIVSINIKSSLKHYIKFEFDYLQNLKIGFGCPRFKTLLVIFTYPNGNPRELIIFRAVTKL